MKRMMTVFGALLLAASAWADVAGYMVSDVQLFSQRPWDKGVDVWFTVTPPAGGTTARAVELDIVASNGVDEVYVSDAAILSRMAKTSGRQHIIWRPDIDHPGVSFGELKLYISVKREVTEHPPYLYVNLGDGSVGYAGLGFAKAASKAFAIRDNLVFRYIPPTTSDEWKEISGGKDTFSFGMPAENAGTAAMNDSDRQREDSRHEVKLTKGFYFGVTPLTIGQYAMLGFKGKSRQDGSCFEAIRGISYEAARGEDSPDKYDYPQTDDVDPNSIVGKVRSLTGLKFDLPTNFQWEYALRAGSTNAYLFTTTDRVPTADELNRQWHHSYVPTDRPANYWGIYAFIGCCHQWTLTLGRTTDSTSANNYYRLTEDATDPTGPTLTYDHGYRIARGSHAGANGYETQKRVYRIGYKYPLNAKTPADSELNFCGVRLCLTLDD